MTYHRYEPYICKSARRRSPRFVVVLLASFAIGALFSWAGGALAAPSGAVLSRLASAADSPFESDTWRRARLSVEPDAFVKSARRE